MPISSTLAAVSSSPSQSDLAQVEYASLPNFEEREEDFRAESVILRRRFTTDGVDIPF